jgi:hydroxymethylpyrimidine/phosphomethylpyrimidine kinase
METFNNTIPTVMVFTGNDPTGGGGIQANCETLKAINCHALPIMTCVTVQDTHEIKGIYPLPTTLVIEQARAILEDVKIDAFKIGLLGSQEIASSIHTLLTDYPNIPVVLDLETTNNRSTALIDELLYETMTSLLFPLTSILTITALEAKKLAPQADTLDACGQMLLDMGCGAVLITGHQTEKNQINNLFYSNRRLIKQFPWRHLPYTYHGDSCTLSASIAGFLAQKLDVSSAIHEGQRYTMKTLENAYRLGMGNLIPDRLFWVKHQQS